MRLTHLRKRRYHSRGEYSAEVLSNDVFGRRAKHGVEIDAWQMIDEGRSDLLLRFELRRWLLERRRRGWHSCERLRNRWLRRRLRQSETVEYVLHSGWMRRWVMPVVAFGSWRMRGWREDGFSSRWFARSTCDGGWYCRWCCGRKLGPSDNRHRHQQVQRRAGFWRGYRRPLRKRRCLDDEILDLPQQCEPGFRVVSRISWRRRRRRCGHVEQGYRRRRRRTRGGRFQRIGLAVIEERWQSRRLKRAVIVATG